MHNHDMEEHERMMKDNRRSLNWEEFKMFAVLFLGGVVLAGILIWIYNLIQNIY